MTKGKPLFEWPKELTKEQEKAYEEHLKEDHFNALLDYFCITEDPAALAVYVRAGGDIGDQKTRELIASLLDKVPYKHSRTRSFAEESMETYLAVEMLRVYEPGLSVPKAIERFADERSTDEHDLSEETVRSRYKKGKKWVRGTRPRG